MYWTLELASYLSDAPWPATKDELIDYSIRTGAPLEVVENLQSIEDEGDQYESIQEIWPDYPTDEDYLWNEDRSEEHTSELQSRENLVCRLLLEKKKKKKKINQKQTILRTHTCRV